MVGVVEHFFKTKMDKKTYRGLCRKNNKAGKGGLVVSGECAWLVRLARFANIENNSHTSVAQATNGRRYELLVTCVCKCRVNVLIFFQNCPALTTLIETEFITLSQRERITPN